MKNESEAESYPFPAHHNKNRELLQNEHRAQMEAKRIKDHKDFTKEYR